MEALTTNLSAVMSAVTSVATLFTEFPMNLFLAGSIAGIALAIFRRAKNTAKG